jgi:hypothetical protein
MNKATEIMLKWTIEFESGCTYERGVQFNGEDIEEQWNEHVYFHSDEYDKDWFALIATDSIRKTIDWDYIAKELPNHLQYE